MASSRTSEREEERSFNLRTLAIASVASATAAVVTSQLWFAGTWIAAAITPVLVALISELLHRPTERIADRVAADRPSLRRDRDTRAQRAEQASSQPSPPPARVAANAGSAPIRVYRSTGPATRRSRIALGAVLATGALALVIAVFALTVPELIAGGAIGKGDRTTTFFSRDRERARDDADAKQAAPQTRDESEQPTEATTREQTAEPPATAPPVETPTTTTPPAGEPPPTGTAPAPAPGAQP